MAEKRTYSVKVEGASTPIKVEADSVVTDADWIRFEVSDPYAVIAVLPKSQVRSVTS